MTPTQEQQEALFIQGILRKPQAEFANQVMAPDISAACKRERTTNRTASQVACMGFDGHERLAVVNISFTTSLREAAT